MVNEAYLNRVNETFLWLQWPMKPRQVDGLYPFRFRIDHQRAECERDAVGNSAVLAVEPQQPFLRTEHSREEAIGGIGAERVSICHQTARHKRDN